MILFGSGLALALLWWNWAIWLVRNWGPAATEGLDRGRAEQRRGSLHRKAAEHLARASMVEKSLFLQHTLTDLTQTCGKNAKIVERTEPAVSVILVLVKCECSLSTSTCLFLHSNIIHQHTMHRYTNISHGTITFYSTTTLELNIEQEWLLYRDS